jgi:hypothetical protein
MTNWGQWYSGYNEDDIEFVTDLVSFLQEKLDRCDDLDDIDANTIIKKKRLSIQLQSIRYLYNL